MTLVLGVVGYACGYITGAVITFKIFAYMLRREDRLLQLQKKTQEDRRDPK